MIIRAMNLKDYEEVDKLMQQLHQVHVNGRPDLFVPLEHPYSAEKFSELINDSEVISILAEENGEIAGLCFASMRNKSGMAEMRTAYMDDLVVAEEWQHQGIARALFAQAEKNARELGAERLDLMVWSFNEKAKRLYEELGMVPQIYIYEKRL